VHAGTASRVLRFRTSDFLAQSFFIDDRETVHGSDDYPGTFSQSLNAFTFFCGVTYSVADLYHRHKTGKKTAD
jgi:hypothetical protein